MKIEHIAIWCRDLEKMKHFYQHYFNASSNDKYTNPKKGFSSYFLSFPEGARIELMHMAERTTEADSIEGLTGYAHLAFSVGSEADVERMSAQFVKDGFTVIDGPRRTGDGYYECAIRDPEGNTLEITV